MRWLVALMIAFAGCASPVTQEAPAPIEAATPVWQTWNLSADGSLVLDPQDHAVTALDWSYDDWVQGTRAPEWRGPVTEQPFRVLEGSLQLSYVSTAPLVASGDLRPELTAWWGSDSSIQHHVFMDGPDVVTTGTRIDVESALRIPEGGFVYGPGSIPTLRVGHYYLGAQAQPMQLMTGPSQLHLLVEPVAFPSHTTETVLDVTGDLLGNRCLADANVNDMAQAFHTLELTDRDAISVRLSMTGQTRDIDFAVRGPDGQDVGGGHGSDDVEGADVWWPNTAAAGNGTYTIQIYACTPQVSTYHLVVEQHRA